MKISKPRLTATAVAVSVLLASQLSMMSTAAADSSEELRIQTEEALKGKKVPIQEVLVQGQELMVQVVKDEIGNKGASLTTYIALPGRCLVLMADSDKTGVSRRASNEERQRIKQLVNGLPVPEGFGLIVRTAAEGQPEEALQNDLEYLSRLWTKLQERYRTLRGAGVIHQ